MFRVQPLLPINPALYTQLKTELDKPKPVLYVQTKTNQTEETLLRILGRGGSKKAFDMGKDRALLLPNTDADPSEETARRWEKMVLEEVKISKILEKIGLLSPLSRRVDVKLPAFPEEIIPAYISKTFSSLSEEGCFIIDTKSPSTSTFIKKHHFLFKSDEERLVVENWNAVFKPLLQDIAKICLYKIPVDWDSVNIAMIKKSDSEARQYEARYFGFDFSSKSGFTQIPDITNKLLPSTEIDKSTQNDAELILKRIISKVFECEFSNVATSDTEKKEKVTKLKTGLISEYLETIFGIIRSGLVA